MFISTSGPGEALLPIPALLTRMSIGPSAWLTLRGNSKVAARSNRSTVNGRALPPVAAIAATASSSSPAERAASATCGPFGSQGLRDGAADSASGSRHQGHTIL